MSGIQQDKKQYHFLRKVYVAVYDFRQFGSSGLADFRVAVPGKVYEIPTVIYQKVVDQLCLARS